MVSRSPTATWGAPLLLGCWHHLGPVLRVYEHAYGAVEPKDAVARTRLDDAQDGLLVALAVAAAVANAEAVGELSQLGVIEANPLHLHVRLPEEAAREARGEDEELEHAPHAVHVGRAEQDEHLAARAQVERQHPD